MISDVRALIPHPRKLDWLDGEVCLSDSRSRVKVFCVGDESDGLNWACEALARAVFETSGALCDVNTADAAYLQSAPHGSVVLNCGDSAYVEGDEGYRLSVRDTVTIEARKPAGLFYGVQTLRQLMTGADGKLLAARCEIEDRPTWNWRGIMLDQGRNYQSVEFLKKQIDIASFYKLNVFHVHLTEYPGWRFETKAYPNLKSEQYYTQQQLRELVDYAAARFMTVMPEIEMPGHATAFLRMMPHLKCSNNVMCMGNEELYSVLETILTEVAEVFDSPYIHIGTDECQGGADCPKCAAKWAEISAQPNHPPTLMAYFIDRMNEVVKKLGRTTVVWNDQLDNGLPKDVIIHSWRNDSSAVEVAKAGYKTINSHCPEVYFDLQIAHEQVKTIYEWSPNNGEPLPIENILGGQGEAWHDPPVDYEDQILEDLGFYPKLITVAERVWAGTDTEPKPFEQYHERLLIHKRRFFEGMIFPYPVQSDSWKDRYKGIWPPADPDLVPEFANIEPAEENGRDNQ